METDFIIDMIEHTKYDLDDIDQLKQSSPPQSINQSSIDEFKSDDMLSVINVHFHQPDPLYMMP